MTVCQSTVTRTYDAASVCCQNYNNAPKLKVPRARLNFRKLDLFKNVSCMVCMFTLSKKPQKIPSNKQSLYCVKMVLNYFTYKHLLLHIRSMNMLKQLFLNEWNRRKGANIHLKTRPPKISRMIYQEGD